MTRQKHAGPTSERFITETLDLIDERGGSQGVNLREVSRRVGCAHTNAYNYFASFEDLLWAAFRRVLYEYGQRLTRDLHADLEPAEYLRQVVVNLAAFPQERPGWYRFIGSDPIDMERIPADVLETVTGMKQWLFDVFLVCLPRSDRDGTPERTATIALAYVDGESFSLINDRTIPGEDVGGRIVDNTMRLIAALAPDASQGHRPSRTPAPAYPVLEMEG